MAKIFLIEIILNLLKIFNVRISTPKNEAVMRLIIVAVFATLITFGLVSTSSAASTDMSKIVTQTAAEQTVNSSQPNECKNPHVKLDDGSVRPATEEDLARADEINVICCCNTYNGMCCGETGFCGGFVPGCYCTGRSEERPVDHL